MRLGRWFLAFGVCAACEGVLPAADLERMIAQPSLRPFEQSPRFADGRAMRPPPLGTVSRSRILGQPAFTEGIAEGRYAEEIPLPLSLAVLRRGRDRYDTFCAVCHGVAGYGITPVASNMLSRKPPSLVSPPVTGFPPGRIYQAISVGYGLMPAYDNYLPVPDRWAVVAYVQALQASQNIRLGTLPPELRREALDALEGLP